MNEDWGKAIAQLCVIVQNNTDLKEPVLQYVEFMKTIYGIDGADFLDIYREWERSGEIVDKREKVSCTGLEIWKRTCTRRVWTGCVGYMMKEYLKKTHFARLCLKKIMR